MVSQVSGLAAKIEIHFFASQLLELVCCSVQSTSLVVIFHLLNSLVDTKAKALKLLAIGASGTLTDQAQAVGKSTRYVAILVHLHHISGLLANLTDLYATVAADL